jgi:hypothetical protein
MVGSVGLTLRGYPETIEIIELNPRNMPIPRYYRLSVSTGTNCPHDSDSGRGPAIFFSFLFFFFHEAMKKHHRLDGSEPIS